MNSFLSTVMVIDSAVCRYKFQAVPDIFTNHEAGVYTTTLPGLGLIEQEFASNSAQATGEEDLRNKKPWERLNSHIEQLDSESPETTSYKVLFIVRHGFGYHNEYMAKVGHEAWNVHDLIS